MIRLQSLFCMLLVGSVWLGCSTRHEETQQQLTFEIKTIATSSPQGCKPPDSTCVSFTVSYPVFSGKDSVALQKLKAVIDTSLMQGDKDAHGKAMSVQVDDYLRQYQKFRAAMPELSEPWYYKGELTPVLVGDSLISIAVREENYTGGAHGTSTVHFINVRPNGAKVTLSDVLKPGYEATLTNIGEKIFRQNHNLPPTASLLERSFEFPDDRFKLPSNYGFTPKGIVFYYNSYEIGSHADGPTELIIPYQELTSLLPPH